MNHSLVEPYLKLLEPIRCFLLCPTPQEWIQQAAREENLPVILLDHLHCELKAAQSAALLLRRYA
ncbi:MAG TPA: tRNA-(ms[2]io[6]A)-hydroxylase, partial [Idiomarina abyssalis]|nr:tRNA-(ms[2]io[6]A)-hydroxylase [Idiomarina abyssalis]